MEVSFFGGLGICHSISRYCTQEYTILLSGSYIYIIKNRPANPSDLPNCKKTTPRKTLRYISSNRDLSHGSTAVWLS